MDAPAPRGRAAAGGGARHGRRSVVAGPGGRRADGGGPLLRRPQPRSDVGPRGARHARRRDHRGVHGQRRRRQRDRGGAHPPRHGRRRERPHDRLRPGAGPGLRVEAGRARHQHLLRRAGLLEGRAGRDRRGGAARRPHRRRRGQHGRRGDAGLPRRLPPGAGRRRPRGLRAPAERVGPRPPGGPGRPGRGDPLDRPRRLAGARSAAGALDGGRRGLGSSPPVRA